MESNVIYPEPVVRVFVEIEHFIYEHHFLDDDPQIATGALFEAEKAKHECMKDIELNDYHRYWGDQARRGIIRQMESIPCYTASELFQKLQYDPLITQADSKNFETFINTSYFPKTIELGKLNGETPFRFAPYTNNLPFEKLPRGLALTEVLAKSVSYADGHLPSEESVDPDGDTVLRRFREVGYIIKRSRYGLWGMTGHILVIDLDRNRHPWLILASDWEDYDEEYPVTSTAPGFVMMNDYSVQGVFPDDGERTVIAKFVPLPSSSQNTAVSSSIPFLLQFGEGFEFGLERPRNGVVAAPVKAQIPAPTAAAAITAVEDCGIFLQGGPSLPRIMTWFKKPNGEEVCFDENRGLYMTRDPATGQYVYPQSRYVEWNATAERAVCPDPQIWW